MARYLSEEQAEQALMHSSRQASISLAKVDLKRANQPIPHFDPTPTEADREKARNTILQWKREGLVFPVPVTDL